MSILNIENLTFGYGDMILLKNVSLRLLKNEHVGFVGINGSGKSTLFNLLIGSLIPDGGSINKASTLKIGYLDQKLELSRGVNIRDYLRTAFAHLYEKERKMIDIGDRLSELQGRDMEKKLEELGRLQEELIESDFYRLDSIIENVANGLGISALGMDTPVDKLSGGQRTKVKLANILLKDNDLLLLDEPTNYLDKEHIDWLSEYLKGYNNSFIVISHDTEFLNRVTNVIYHLEFTNIKRFTGNYETFLKQLDENRRKYIDEYNKQQKEIAKLEDYVRKNIVRASTTKMAKSRQKVLNKMERLERPKIQIVKPNFTFLMARQSGEWIFETSNLNIGYNFPLIENLNLKLKRGEKVAITGCNGIGKSTFLKTIMGVLEPLRGELQFGNFVFPLYFEQEGKSNPKTPLQEIGDEFPSKNQKEIRTALARSGLSQEHVLKNMNQLSGGEQSKVRLCKLMMNKSNWLILDEPTNHLDKSAKEALKEALVSYDGTILIVCHEKEFYGDFITGEWNMESLRYRS